VTPRNKKVILIISLDFFEFGQIISLDFSIFGKLFVWIISFFVYLHPDNMRVSEVVVDSR